MASFVREVLAASGTLDKKEDFAVKTTKVQKKLNDLKSQLAIHIENRYSNYSTTLSNTTKITAQMERLVGEVEALELNINKHFRAELVDRNKELTELSDGIQELNLTLQIVGKIKCCYDLMEESNEHLSSGKWFAAAQSLNQVFNLLRHSFSQLNEADIKILPAIKRELVAQKHKLYQNLKNQWQQSVCVRTTDDKKGNVTTHTLSVHGGAAGNFSEHITELVQALYATDVLDDVIAPFVQHLDNEFINVIVTMPTAVRTTDNELSVSVPRQTDKKRDPMDVFENLRLFFSFISKNLCAPLDTEGKAGTLIQRIGAKLSSSFCQTVIKEVLAPAVPSSVSLLAEYEEVLSTTETFHEYVVSTGFLPESNVALLNYARNVDALFANKICQDLLVEARELMKEDMFTTVRVEPGPVEGAADPLNQPTDGPDLPIPPNFTLPEKTFQFPGCAISTSTLKVLDLATRGLEEAVSAKPFCSIRLFNTVRNMFELWCAVIPTFHKSSLESLPQLSAIAHNSAMYLAHRLVTLGYVYRERLPALSQHNPTFIDIVPRLRNVGGEIMLRSMRLQRDTVISTLSNAGMNSAGSERRLSSGVDQAVRQFLHQLKHLQKVWSPVLPTDIYYRCIGSLMNAGVEEIIQRILSLSDISAEVSGQYCSLLNQIVSKAPELFTPEEPESHVKKWAKFLELIVVLNSSLRVIEERWGEGAGVLAKEFTADQVKQLIRAIFQNTERRAAVLSKIK